VSSDIPLWVAAVIGLGPSLVAIVAIVDANLRDRRRIEQEWESRLRDERIAAYRRLLTATTTAPTECERVNALAAASEEISLLASTDEIDRAALEVCSETDLCRILQANFREGPFHALGWIGPAVGLHASLLSLGYYRSLCFRYSPRS